MPRVRGKGSLHKGEAEVGRSRRRGLGDGLAVAAGDDGGKFGLQGGWRKVGNVVIKVKMVGWTTRN